MKRVIGTDIHRTFAEVVVREDGRLRPHGRVDMTRSGLEGFGRTLSKDDEVVVEATGNAMAVVRVLIPAGRTGDGSIGRLRRSGGIVFGDAAMPAPLPIRTDHDPAELRRLARRERDGRVSARLLALANALEGIPREKAARLAGMTGQTLGDW